MTVEEYDALDEFDRSKHDLQEIEYGESVGTELSEQDKESIRMAIEALRWAVNSLDEQTMEEGCLKALKCLLDIEGINL